MTGPVFNAGAIEATARIDKSQFRRDLREMAAEIKAFEKNTRVANLALALNTSQARTKLAAYKREIEGYKATNLPVGANTKLARAEVASLKQWIEKERADISVGIDDTRARAQLARLKEQSKIRMEIQPEVGNVNDFRTEAQRAVDRTAPVTKEVNLNIDKNTEQDLRRIAAAAKGVETAERQVDSAVDKVTKTRRRWLNVSEDAVRSAEKLERAERELADAEDNLARVTEDSESSERSLEAAHKRLDRASESLRDKEIAADKARRSLLNTTGDLQRAEDELSRRRESVTGARDRYERTKIDVDHSEVGEARREIERTRAAANRLRNTDIDLRGGDRTNRMLGLIVASLVAISAAGPAAVAALTSVMSMAGMVGQTASAAALGFNGISDAMSAMDQADTASTASGASNAASRRNAIRSVENAQRQAARTAIQGAESVEDAQRALTRAEEDAIRTREELNDAYKEAAENLEDLSLSLESLAIDEEDAIDRLQEAEADLAQARANGADAETIDDLDRAYRRAELSVRQVKEEHEDLKAEYDETSRAGVEGSKAVTDARRKMRDADEAVAEATRDLSRAQRDAAEANADAARAVVEAMEGMSEASAGGSAANDKLRESFEKLTPEGQAFVRFMHDDWKPAWREVGAGVQTAMLPEMEMGLRRILSLTPTFNSGLSDTGAIIGRLTLRGAEMMNSGPWRRDLPEIMGQNNRVLMDFGDIGLSILDTWRNLYVVSGPMTERFTNFATAQSHVLNGWIEQKRATGELDMWYQRMGNRLSDLGDVTYDIISALYHFSEAVQPVADAVLGVVSTISEAVKWMSEWNSTVVALVVGAGLLYKAFTLVGNITARTIINNRNARTGWAALLGTQRAQTTAAGQNAAANRIAGASAQAAGAQAARGAAGFGALGAAAAGAGASAGAAGAMARFGAVARMLPGWGLLIGLGVGAGAMAFKGLTTDAKEGAEALMRGGEAAEKMRNKLEDSSLGIGVFNTSLGAANREMWEMRSRMSELERANSIATEAQNDYTYAVYKFGKESPEAIEAQKKLGRVTQDQAEAQENAARETENNTNALTRQRDLILGIIDTKAELNTSYFEMIDAQKRWNEVQATGVEGTREWITAQDERDVAVKRWVEAIAAQAESEAKAAGIADINGARMNALAGRMQELVDIGGPTSAAVQAVAATLDTSALAAIGATRENDNAGNAYVRLKDGMLIPLPTSGFQPATDAATNLARSINNAETAYGNMLRALATPLIVTGNLPGVGLAPGTTVGRQPAGGPSSQFGYYGDLTGVRAHGGIDHRRGVVGMAGGGFRAGNSSIASIVGPNQLTVMGDRKWGREGYIPDDGGSARSLAILRAVASWFNMSLVPMAGGGILERLIGAGSRGGTPNRAFLGAAPNAILGTGGGGPGGDDLVGTVEGEILPVLDELAGRFRDQLPDTFKSFEDVARDTWAANAARVAESVTAQSEQFEALRANLGMRQQEMARSTDDFRLRHQEAWDRLTRNTSDNTSLITNTYFPGLRQGMSATEQAATNMGEVFEHQLGRIREGSRSPIRYMIDEPINKGMVVAWNEINKMFALDKVMNPIVANFATGGQVRSLRGVVGGAGIGDSVDARLTPGEIVWDTRAVKNAGGVEHVESMRKAFRAGIIGPRQNLGSGLADGRERQNMMRVLSLDDKTSDVFRYAYGGVQPHVAFAGQEIERLFGPMPGGIGGVGQRANASDHPSGHALDFMTLRDKPLGDRVSAHLLANARRLLVKYLIWQQAINEGSGWSRMEDRGSITANHFDHVHSSFLRMGGGGRDFMGGGEMGFMLDSAAIVRDKFAASFAMIDKMKTLFPDSYINQAAQAQGRQSLEAAIGWAAQNIMPAFGAGDISVGQIPNGPVQDQVRAAAAAFGWNQGPEWDALSWIIQKESGWNPNAANPTSSARGLFQKMTSIHGPIEPTVAGQAQWGLNYIRNRYGSPTAAKAFWVANGWYAQGGPVKDGFGISLFDQGGPLQPGVSVVDNRTGETEGVFRSDQLNTLIRASRNVGKAHAQVEMSRVVEDAVRATVGAISINGAGGGVHVTVNFQLPPDWQRYMSESKIAREVATAITHAGKQGIFGGGR